MSIAEKAEMLSIVTKEIYSQIDTVARNIQSYVKTYPELKLLLSVLISVSLVDETLVGFRCGDRKALKAVVRRMIEEMDNDE